MRGKKKVIIPAVIVVFVVVVALVLIYLFQTGAFKTKLQKLEEKSNAYSHIDLTWDYYEDEIQGTRYEDQGREVMLNALEDTLKDGYTIYRLIKYRPDYLAAFVDFLKEIQTDDSLYEQANATLTAYQGMLDLSEALTDPFDIYATPSAYYGETVTLIGEIESNDVRRRMLHIDVGNLRYLEVSYEYAGVISALLNEDSPEKSADEWLHVEGGYIVAIGEVKQYTDSTNAFLATTRISELGDCNWEAISNYIN